MGYLMDARTQVPLRFFHTGTMTSDVTINNQIIRTTFLKSDEVSLQKTISGSLRCMKFHPLRRLAESPLPTPQKTKNVPSRGRGPCHITVCNGYIAKSDDRSKTTGKNPLKRDA